MQNFGYNNETVIKNQITVQQTKCLRVRMVDLQKRINKKNISAQNNTERIITNHLKKGISDKTHQTTKCIITERIITNCINTKHKKT